MDGTCLLTSAFRYTLPRKIAIFLSGVAIFYLALVIVKRQRKQYPPGPPSQPLLGVTNIHPTSEFWKTYADWGIRYGDEGIISFHVLGRRIVVINSAAAARELLIARALTYSDRPFPTMAAKIMQRGKSLFYSKYNADLRETRKLFDTTFNPTTCKQYSRILEHEAKLLVHRIADTPDAFIRHTRINAASVIMQIAYGYTVTSEEDRFYILAEQAIQIASLASAPGKWIVDSIPLLRFWPSFLPGGGFKRKAREWSQLLTRQRMEPFEYAKREILQGTYPPSFTAHFLCPENPTTVEEDIVSWAASALYAAGSDTTAAVMRTFFYQMATNLTVQARAQAEVDSFLNERNRLPTLSDRTSFPYVNALIKELLRWATPTPMALPHCTDEDDTYAGYDIDAGTLVIPNIWAMLHDEDEYPDAMTFDPERFIIRSGEKGGQPDPLSLIFGLGKRSCPGRYIAEMSIFIQIITVLITLDVRRKVGEDGKDVEMEMRFTTGIVSHLEAFECDIRPRDNEVLSWVRQELEDELDD